MDYSVKTPFVCLPLVARVCGGKGWGSSGKAAGSLCAVGPLRLSVGANEQGQVVGQMVCSNPSGSLPLSRGSPSLAAAHRRLSAAWLDTWFSGPLPTLE